MKNLLLFFTFTCVTVVVSAQAKIGELAPEIALPNANDSIIKLSSFRGKVVLVDFWASWCGPCRASHPAMVRLFNRYKEKDLQVFGVSIDSKKADWLKAMRQDKISYLQVNDRMGWNSVVGERYGLEQIPTSFLLDKSGKIIAIDLEGKELEKRIDLLLAQ